jgi:hypothetical protein
MEDDPGAPNLFCLARAGLQLFLVQCGTRYSVHHSISHLTPADHDFQNAARGYDHWTNCSRLASHDHAIGNQVMRMEEDPLLELNAILRLRKSLQPCEP